MSAASINALKPNGIASRIPYVDYAAAPGTSITRLKELRRSPLHYQYRLGTPKESAPLTLGNATHCAVLEPERFDRTYAVWDRQTDSGRMSPRSGKAWDAFCDEHAGRTIITATEYAEAMAMQKAVRSSPLAMRYLQNGDPEISMQWSLGERLCKGRGDWLTYLDEPYLVGLKTSRDCRHFPFSSQAAKLGYHLQWAYYYDGFLTITSRKPNLIEIVVENEAPHAVAVYRIPNDIIEQGRDEYHVLLKLLDECEERGEWPGPVIEEESLTLPAWVYERNDDLTDLDLEM